MKRFLAKDIPTDLVNVDRFWSRVDKSGPVPAHAPELGPCWIWTGAKAKGYGQFVVSGQLFYAHRIAFRMTGAALDPCLELDHLCRVSGCVNPSHLEQVTTRINTIRNGGPSALNAAKTECSRGHTLAGANLRIRAEGWRVCRACYREGDRRRRAARALAVAKREGA